MGHHGPKTDFKHHTPKWSRFVTFFSIIEQEAYKSVHFPDATLGVFRADIISAKQRKGGCSTQTQAPRGMMFTSLLL